MLMKRVVVLVLDGCGAGTAPDAAEYGDGPDNFGNTLVHVAQAVGGLKVPNLRRLGLGNLLELAGGEPLHQGQDSVLIGNFGRLTESSLGGKDTVTGHWEMMGIAVPARFPTYPAGFPAEIIQQFEKAIGRKSLGNCPSSGTVILDQLGQQSKQEGSPIVYTSADSVFQIAAHEHTIPIEELYDICLKARSLLVEPHNVQRVIARPFLGDGPGNFKRTERRKDFPITPPPNVIDAIYQAGHFVAGVGVIPEVFASRNFSYAKRTQNNPEHMQETLRLLAEHSEGFFFVNFEDFDMLYGHRNDPRGFANCLEEFDASLGRLLEQLGPQDLLMITADHGNDPTTPGTDHSREFAPLLLFSSSLPGGVDYGIRPTFAEVGATAAAALGVTWSGLGQSLLA